MRLILLGLLVSTFAFGQNCSPEALENEKQLLNAGEFKGAALLSKLESLAKELKILSSVRYQGAQKNAMKYCLKIKDQLFQKLMVRPEPSIQENASFQETVSDFYNLHNDKQTALIYMERAIEIEPKNIGLLVKNLRLFAEAQNIQLKEIAEKPIALNETRRLFSEFSRKASKIAEHPEATKELALEALSYQAKIAKALGNHSQEMQFLEKIITLDPTNQNAQQTRLNYFISKNEIANALEAMKKITRDKLDKPQNWTSFLQMLATSEKWDEFVSWYNKADVKVLGANPQLKIYLARAYLELNRRSEADMAMKDLPKKLSASSQKLARQNLSRLKELQADDFKAEGRISEALDEYKNALKHSPRPLTVKEKISLLIYEYRKGLNFEPPEATRKDLEEVTKLLEQSVYKTELKSNLFAIYLHSVKFAQKNSELKRACGRFKEVYPELLRGKDYISYCQPLASQPIRSEDDPLNNNRQL